MLPWRVCRARRLRQSRQWALRIPKSASLLRPTVRPHCRRCVRPAFLDVCAHFVRADPAPSDHAGRLTLCWRLHAPHHPPPTTPFSASDLALPPGSLVPDQRKYDREARVFSRELECEMQDCIVRGSIPRSWDSLPWTSVCVHAFTPLLATILTACAPGAPRYHDAHDALVNSSPPAAETFEAETPLPGRGSPRPSGTRRGGAPAKPEPRVRAASLASSARSLSRRRPRSRIRCSATVWRHASLGIYHRSRRATRRAVAGIPIPGKARAAGRSRSRRG